MDLDVVDGSSVCVIPDAIRFKVEPTVVRLAVF